MNIEICKESNNYIWGFHVPFNAWYGCDSEGWWICTVHGEPEEQNTLELRRFNGEYWVKVREQSGTTQNICQWATTMHLWWTKCYWFKDEDRQKSLVTKHQAHIKSIQNMMRHERKYKSVGSGIRLDKENYYADKTITDYECRKNTMHDFQRVYN